MTRTTKTFLALSMAAFAVGSAGFLWGIGIPLGAVCFGLFLISTVLEKESALFDEEQRLHVASARPGKAALAGRFQEVTEATSRGPQLTAGAHSS